MSAPATLAEAQAECIKQKLGPSACADLISPFCGGRGVVIEFQKPPRCVAGELSPQKAAILLAEAEARASASAPTPWLLIAGAIAVVGVVVYAATR